MKLQDIHSPADIKGFSLEELEILCEEVRQVIIDTVSKTGGHLASSLGAVELTVALHQLFDSPNDQIVWDVGHQAYAHKLLTGRYSSFGTLRQEGGISGFIRPSESEHDSFVSGHASNALSAACGLARAELLKGTENTVIAVMGDGSLTGGMAYEALNNASELKNLIVIINDNEMSISKTVGGMAHYFSHLRTNQGYLQTKKYLEQMLDKTPLVGKTLRQGLDRSKLQIKKMVYQADLFHAFGFSYLGNVNGHSLSDLKDALLWAKKIQKPAMIQVVTKKGKGYLKAEDNPGAYHSVSTFDIRTGNPDISPSDSYSAVFGKELSSLAQKDSKICAVTAAMKYGTGLQYFSMNHKDRFFDVGIAEEHAVTFCAGLAKGGMTPVFAVYSTFLQRGFDQVIHDAAIDRLHIILAIDRAGVVGEDGETHQGVFDLPYLSMIPNVTVFSPANYSELKSLLYRAIYKEKSVVAIRYPRGAEVDSIEFGSPDADFTYDNKGGSLLVTYGRLSFEARKAIENLRENHHKVSFLKLQKVHPIPEEALKIAKGHSEVFFFEEGVRSGGAGQQMLDLLNQNGFKGKFHLHSLQDHFITQSKVARVLEKEGLNSESMEKAIAGRKRKTFLFWEEK